MGTHRRDTEPWWARLVADTITAVGERNAELERQVADLRGALEDFRDHGTNHDTMPTVMGNESTEWWYRYIQSADDSVRQRARYALGERREGE